MEIWLGPVIGMKYWDPLLSPFYNVMDRALFFNKTPHTCHVSRTFLRQNNVQVLDWPVRSPDLSPIELVLDVLGRRVRRRQNKPRNLQELAQTLIQEWSNIPANVIRRHTRSMRRRINAVLKANGGHTRY